MVQPLIGKAGISDHCPLYKAGISYIIIASYLWQAYHILAPYHYKRQAYIYLLFPLVWNSAGFVPQVEQPHNQSFNSAALL